MFLQVSYINFVITMNKLINVIALISIFCCFHGKVKAQTDNQSISRIIYEVGEPISTCESNFKNLFKNWNPGIITNADDLFLIGYSFVETIADSITINQYTELFTGNDAIISTISKSSHSGSNYANDHSELYFKIRSFSSLCDTTNLDRDEKIKMLNAFEQERKNLKFYINKMVNIGDKVYVLIFRDKKRTYTNFVICSANTKKVVYDNLFKNITIWEN